MEIIVSRVPADQEGVDIFDPLLNATTAAIERGRQHLDDNSGLQEISLECVFRPNFRNGQLVEIIDQLQGISYRGKIISVEHRALGGEVVSTIRVVR